MTSWWGRWGRRRRAQIQLRTGKKRSFTIALKFGKWNSSHIIKHQRESNHRGQAKGVSNIGIASALTIGRYPAPVVAAIGCGVQLAGFAAFFGEFHCTPLKHATFSGQRSGWLGSEIQVWFFVCVSLYSLDLRGCALVDRQILGQRGQRAVQIAGQHFVGGVGRRGGGGGAASRLLRQRTCTE